MIVCTELYIFFYRYDKTQFANHTLSGYFGGVLKSRLALKVNRKSMLSSLIPYGLQSFKNCSNFNQPTF